MHVYINHERESKNMMPPLTLYGEIRAKYKNTVV
jgi:hypothetical protein